MPICANLYETSPPQPQPLEEVTNLARKDQQCPIQKQPQKFAEKIVLAHKLQSSVNLSSTTPFPPQPQIHRNMRNPHLHPALYLAIVSTWNQKIVDVEVIVLLVVQQIVDLGVEVAGLNDPVLLVVQDTITVHHD